MWFAKSFKYRQRKFKRKAKSQRLHIEQLNSCDKTIQTSDFPVLSELIDMLTDLSFGDVIVVSSGGLKVTPPLSFADVELFVRVRAFGELEGDLKISDKSCVSSSSSLVPTLELFADSKDSTALVNLID